jgi:hypothetical protein
MCRFIYLGLGMGWTVHLHLVFPVPLCRIGPTGMEVA